MVISQEHQEDLIFSSEVDTYFISDYFKKDWQFTLFLILISLGALGVALLI